MTLSDNEDVRLGSIGVELYNDIETVGYYDGIEAQPTMESVLKKYKELQASFTPSGKRPEEFLDRKKYQSNTLETARMLRDTGMPPGYFGGGVEAQNALSYFETAQKYVNNLRQEGVAFLTREHLEDINRLVNGHDLKDSVNVIRDYSAISRERKLGLSWEFPKPEGLSNWLDEVVQWQIDAQRAGVSNEELSKNMADLLVRLHPFNDGNGRTAMLVEHFYSLNHQ